MLNNQSDSIQFSSAGTYSTKKLTRRASTFIYQDFIDQHLENTLKKFVRLNRTLDENIKWKIFKEKHAYHSVTVNLTLSHQKTQN